MTVPFFLLVGQSNIAGRGYIDDLTEEEKKVSPDIFNMAVKEWKKKAISYHYEKASHKLIYEDDFFFPALNRMQAVGPGLFFAQAIKPVLELDRLGIVCCARGNHGLKHWEKHAEEFEFRMLYEEMIRRAKSAQKVGPCLGLLAYIGETDASDKEDAKLWEERFISLIKNIREDLNTPNLPVVMGELATVTAARKKAFPDLYNYWEEVKKAQRTIQIKNMKKIETQDLEVNSAHLTTAAHRVLGNRFAKAMAMLILNKNTG